MKHLLYLILLTAALGNASTVTFTYDPAGRLADINYGGSTNTVLSFDNNGNLISLASFVSANPDLAVSQAAMPSPAVLGLRVQYQVSIINNSGVSAATVEVTNLLPASAAFLSASASQGTVTRSGSVLEWNVGTLAADSAASLSFDVRPANTGTLSNFVSVTGAQVDPDLSNNGSSLVIPVIFPPALTLRGVGSNFVLSWPVAGGSSFSIEHTDSFVPPVQWLPDSILPSVTSDQFYIAEPMTNQVRFYRLVTSP